MDQGKRKTADLTLRPLKKRCIIDDDTARVTYYPSVFGATRSQHYYDTLKRTLAFSEQQVTLHGETFTVKRKVVMYGDQNCSLDREDVLDWTPELLEIKETIEAQTQDHYDFVVCNLYRDGNDHIGPHSDKEGTHAACSNIASVTFGAERDFFLHPLRKGLKKKSVVLESGSLLVMGGNTQRYWKHSLPTRKNCTAGRINLTFRVAAQQNHPSCED